MERLRLRSESGFTLIELLVVVAHHRYLGGHRYSAVRGLSEAGL